MPGAVWSVFYICSKFGFMSVLYPDVLQNISRYVQLTNEQEAAFCQLIAVKKIKKKQLLLREGNICSHEYFVSKGCLRTYFTDPKGLEHNLYFAIEDWWISDLYSRTKTVPSFCNIVALEDCELLQINHQDLEKFMLEIPALERFFRLLYEQSLVAQHLKSLQLLHMSAAERYIHFREKYPKLAQRIPQKHIATYLGLTPEFFNTVHAKVMRL